MAVLKERRPNAFDGKLGWPESARIGSRWRLRRSVVLAFSTLLASLALATWVLIADVHQTEGARSSVYDSSQSAPVAPPIAPNAPTVGGPTVAFLGDSLTGGSAMGGNGRSNYTQLLESMDGIASVNVAVGGSSYLQRGQSHETFFDEVDQLGGNNPPKLFVVAGSRNDMGKGSPAQLTAAASAVYAKIHGIYPSAKIVVVGPILPVTGPLTDAEATTRDAVKVAADRARLPFIDPLAERWLDSSVTGSDHVHPTDAGHKVIADRMNADLKALGVLPVKAR